MYNHAMTYLYLQITRPRDERGDVPGWVMVTLMTAVVVVALISLARTSLEGLLQKAFDMVGQEAGKTG